MIKLCFIIIAWLLLLNYRFTNKRVFNRVCCFICDLLKSSVIFTVRDYRISAIRIFNAKKVVFLHAVCRVLQISWLFPLGKNWSVRFFWKTSSNVRRTFTTSLPNCSEFYRRKREKMYCQLCCFCGGWRRKISQNAEVFHWACRLLELSSLAHVLARWVRFSSSLQTKRRMYEFCR